MALTPKELYSKRIKTLTEEIWQLNKYNRFVVVLLALAVTMFAQAQNLIKNATVPVSLSKSDFADTIKIKVMDGVVVIPVEIEGKTRNLLFDTGSPLGLWFGQKEDWMKQVTADSLVFGDINKKSRQQVIYQFPTIKMGSLCIENYPMIVEDAMNEFICNRFDGVIGFNQVGMGLSFKLDTKDSLLIGQSADSIFPELVRRH